MTATNIQRSNGPLLLSLFLSHGSGLRAIDQPKRAVPHLLASLFLVDLPILILAGAIVLNHANPETFQGPGLVVAEYVINACLLVVVVSIPVTRLFECRDVLKSAGR